MKFTRWLMVWLQVLALLEPAVLVRPAAAVGNDMPSLQQFRAPYSRRIAVVRPSRLDVAGFAEMRKTNVLNVGNCFDAFEQLGGDVHYYDTEFFDRNQTAWFTLGSYYPLVIVMNPRSQAGSLARYVRGDSTTAQLLVCGGKAANLSNMWEQDTSIATLVDNTLANVNIGASASNKYACAVTNDGKDTLWSAEIPTGRRVGALVSPVTQVVRILRPVIPGGHTAASWMDSTLASHTDWANNTRLPGASATTPKNPGSGGGSPTDSVALAYEYLGPLWKVKTPANGINPNASETWFLKFTGGSQTNVGGQNPCLLWAVICRFTTIPPIKWAYDWDDITDLNPNDGTKPRWRQSGVDSSEDVLFNRGVVPTMMVQPEHAADYAAGRNPRYEAIGWNFGANTDGTGGLDPMTIPPATWTTQIGTWVHHSHDSTASHIASNLVGRYGGYPTGNGASFNQNGTPYERYQRRYASRYQPGANEADLFGASGNFGILNRLLYSDSLRKRTAPNAVIPPYLCFPANQILPMNWKLRPAPIQPLQPPSLVNAWRTAIRIDSVRCASAGSTTLTFKWNWNDSAMTKDVFVGGVGMFVYEGNSISRLGIAPGTYVTAVGSNTLTLSQPIANASTPGSHFTGTVFLCRDHDSADPLNQNKWKAIVPWDSVLWAYDLGIRGGDGTRPGALYLRTGVWDPRNQAPDWDRDSVVAASPFGYPAEVYSTTIGGRKIEAVAVDGILQGAGGRSSYLMNVNYKAAQLLGLKNPVVRGEVNNPNYGEAFSWDMNKMYAGGAGVALPRDFRWAQSSRVVWQHPGQHSDVYTANGDYHVDVFMRGQIATFRLMDAIAGRPTQVCVPGWTVYSNR